MFKPAMKHRSTLKFCLFLMNVVEVGGKMGFICMD